MTNNYIQEGRTLEDYRNQHLDSGEISILRTILNDMITGDMSSYYKENNIRVTYTLDLLTDDIIFDEDPERYVVILLDNSIGLKCYDTLTKSNFISKLLINKKTGQQLVVISGNDEINESDLPDEVVANWFPISRWYMESEIRSWRQRNGLPPLSELN